MQPRTIFLLQQVVGDLQAVEVFARGLRGIEQGIDVGARIVDRTSERGAMIAGCTFGKYASNASALALPIASSAAPSMSLSRARSAILPTWSCHLPGRQARRETVHRAHVGQIGDFVQRLMEQAAVFDTEHVEFRRQTQFERKSLQHPFAHAVHGAEQRLRHLFRELRMAATDQPLAHAVVQFAGGFHRERSADHTRGAYACDQRAFQFFR